MMMLLSQRLTICIALLPLIYATVRGALPCTTAPYQLNCKSSSDKGHKHDYYGSTREYFYVGGQYVDDGTGTGEHLFTDQMYVEKLTPSFSPHHDNCSQPYPLVLIHGQAQTGTNWLNKPDGSPGWSAYFLSQGYTVYIVDQTFRGRSPWMPDNGTMLTYSAENLQRKFTATQNYNLWPQASLHTQWPGTGVMGDPYFDAYYASTVQFSGATIGQQMTVQAAGAALLDWIGTPVILVGHSQGGLMPWLIADARPDLVKGILNLEPTGPPFRDTILANSTGRIYGLTDIPITYDPPLSNPARDLVQQSLPSPAAGKQSCIIQADANPSPRQLINLLQIPVLVVTTEASFHALYDWCTVRYLQQAGVNATHLELGTIGIHGTGHMMFLEKNSDEIVQVLGRWLDWAEKP